MLLPVLHHPPTLSAWLQEVNCWHDLDNTEYDCWPINSPNDYNMISCGGEFVAGRFGLFFSPPRG